MDQGLEKIPKELRVKAWQEALQYTRYKEIQQKFFSVISQVQFGGSTSLNEAERLFKAEQISKKHFLVEQKPSVLTQELVEELQNTFENSARPISQEKDEDKHLLEVLQYYFPDQSSFENFEAALTGKLDLLITDNVAINGEKREITHSNERLKIELYLQNQQKLPAHIQQVVDEYYSAEN